LFSTPQLKNRREKKVENKKGNEINSVPLLRTEKKKQMLWTNLRQELGIIQCNLYLGELRVRCEKSQE
jgi:hypothetical protein